MSSSDTPGEAETTSQPFGYVDQHNQTPLEELRKSVWHETLATWIDLRHYFRQRREILNHPHLDLPQQLIGAKEWKSPLAFAVQGALISILAVSAIGGLLSATVKQRPATILIAEPVPESNSVSLVQKEVPEGETNEAQQKQIQSYIDILQKELTAIEAGSDSAMYRPPVPYSDAYNPTLLALGTALTLNKVPRNQAISGYREQLSALKGELFMSRLSDYVEKAGEKFRYILVPCAFVAAAYAFGFLIRRSRSMAITDPEKLYLYSVTAYSFWPTTIVSALVALHSSIQRLFPQTFQSMVTNLDNALRSIDHLPPHRDWYEIGYQIVVVLAMVAAFFYFVLWCKKIAASRGLSTARLLVKIVLANFAGYLAFVLLFTLSAYAYAAVMLGMKHLQL
jgi:hypothetical protein